MTENKVWMNKRSIQQYLFLYYNIYICCWVLQYFKITNKQQYTNLVTINNWLIVLYTNYNSNNMKKYGKANFKLPFRYNANPKSTPPPQEKFVSKSNSFTLKCSKNNKSKSMKQEYVVWTDHLYETMTVQFLLNNN